MSESANVFNLLNEELPKENEIVIVIPDELQRLYVGIGMPSLRVMERLEAGKLTTLHECLVDHPLYSLVEPVEIRRRYMQLRAEAIQGDADALNDLGWLWLNGSRLIADPALAGRLFSLASSEGCGEALFNLAEMTWYGRGGKPDPALASDYYEQAYKAGMPGAARALGLICENEESGTIQDSGKAVVWFRRAVEEGDVGAGFYLGRLLLDASLKEYDPVQAVYWLQWAAMQGEVSASERLVELYCSVFDSPPDPDGLLRRFWLERAINQGSSRARELCLEEGREVGA